MPPIIKNKENRKNINIVIKKVTAPISMDNKSTNITRSK